MMNRHLSTFAATFGLLTFACTFNAFAAELVASGAPFGARTGWSASQSGGRGLIGVNPVNLGGDLAYVFQNLDTATGTVIPSSKLKASDDAAGLLFGSAVSLWGSSGLVGTHTATISGNLDRGAAYLFRGLDTASGTVTQNVKLLASDGGVGDVFGRSVSLQGSIGLIGAHGDQIGTKSQQGSAYVFRNLDTATGTINQDAKLTASDGTQGDFFGRSVSLAGSTGLIGAYQDEVVTGQGFGRGSAYIFRNLDAATGAVNQHAKLVATDGAADDNFGFALSLSGNTGLVGAYRDDFGTNANQGSAYVYRNLDAVNGTVSQNAKLMASDGAVDDFFGFSASLSGDTGLVGAYGDDIGAIADQGSAYVFLNLGDASGTVTESIKLTASAATANDQFGRSVSLDGDQFVIGAPDVGSGFAADPGRAYSGSVSAVTTLDEGNVSRSIDGISFTSAVDWVIGKTTDANHVTLGVGDLASVAGSGKAIYIGQGDNSDANFLTIKGHLIASELHIGTPNNIGNTLQLENTSTIDAVAFIMGEGNFLRIAGNHTDIGDLLRYLGETELRISDGSFLQVVDSNNHASLIGRSFSSGYTTISAIPELGICTLSGLGVILVFRRPCRPR